MTQDRSAARSQRPPVRSLLERLDRRLAALLLEAERDLSPADLAVFSQKLHDRKEAFWEKHVYPEFRARLDRRFSER